MYELILLEQETSLVSESELQRKSKRVVNCNHLVKDPLIPFIHLKSLYYCFIRSERINYNL